MTSSYGDAIGNLDGTRCLLEWKTTASRYPEEPAGLLALDPQLVCYSWVTGIATLLRWSLSASGWSRFEYFRTVISNEQREESATSFRTQSAGSKRVSSCRTVASAFPSRFASSLPPVIAVEASLSMF